ncbi:MAG: hypothetical protein SFY69_01105 [Planctomycetota bacterium]|nr:hypothetical protein [Planctomycetota bacterium]
MDHQPSNGVSDRRRDSRLVWFLVLLNFAAALGVTVLLLVREQDRGLGLLGLAVVGALGPIVVLMLRRETMSGDRELLARLDDVQRSVRRLADSSVLSDEARRALNRREERDILCRAIEEDLAARNWDAALALIRELADRFGYRAEAEGFRARIDDLRRQSLEQEITEAIGVLDGLVLQRRWHDASLEASKIMRLYPDSPRVEPLRARVGQAYDAFRRDLERRFLLAAQADRTEEALTLLRELDQYLTPVEAEPLRELARGVIGRARQNLGAQFRLALQDHRWAEATRLGQQIVEEFPNSRMAAEVRGMLDGIRQRANQPAPA